MKVFGICMLNSNIKQSINVYTIAVAQVFLLLQSNEDFFCPVVCKETCLTLVSGKVKMPALLSSLLQKKNFDTSLLMPIA